MTTELTPEFAVTVRGYDRAQVDDYVDALREWLANAGARMEAAEGEAAHLREQVLLLRTRLAQLDQQTSETPPRTIVALGDRITRILQLAEEGALAVQADAEAEASAIVGRARQEAEELSRVVRAKQTEAEALIAHAVDEAARVVGEAEGRAAEAAAHLMADAESRAAAREAEAEERALDMVDGAEAERSSILGQLGNQRARMQAELHKLASERDEVVDGLNKLREALHRTIAEVLSAPLLPTAAVELTSPVYDGAAGRDPGDSRQLVAAESRPLAAGPVEQ